MAFHRRPQFMEGADSCGWAGRLGGGGGTPGFQARSERELVIPDRIPLDWSLEFECVCWGDFPQLSNPQP